MADLELACCSLIKDTVFGRRSCAPAQLVLMMADHIPTLVARLRERYYPVDERDLKWLFRTRTRSWLKVTTVVQTDLTQEALRAAARAERDEIRRAWDATRTQQRAAMAVVIRAKEITELADTAKWNADREAAEAEEAEAEHARELWEAEHAGSMLSKEDEDAENARQALNNNKASLFRAKFKAKRSDRRASAQRQLVTNAIADLGQAAQEVEATNLKVGQLRADLKVRSESASPCPAHVSTPRWLIMLQRVAAVLFAQEAKAHLKETQKGKVKLRAKKAQETLTAVTNRLTRALEAKTAAQDSYTACEKLVAVETLQARELESEAVHSIKHARATSGLQVRRGIGCTKVSCMLLPDFRPVLQFCRCWPPSSPTRRQARLTKPGQSTRRKNWRLSRRRLLLRRSATRRCRRSMMQRSWRKRPVPPNKMPSSKF
jgi:hypothetical protein